MIIRSATVADAAAIAGIHVRSWRVTYAGTLAAETLAAVDEVARAALWARRLAGSGDGAILVAEAEDVLGFLQLGPSPDDDADPTAVGQVLAVHVDPDATGSGVGGALLKRAVRTFSAAGFTAGSLWVVRTNAAARRFYERAGWVPDGTTRREVLAVEGEAGEEVTLVRYRIDLGG